METNTIVITSGPSCVLDCILVRQVQISETIYQEVRDRLCEAIGGKNYLSDSLSFPFAGLDCRLNVDVIVYRHEASYPEGRVDEIKDIVPIWWEFHTMKDGEELSNNFLFSELRKYL